MHKIVRIVFLIVCGLCWSYASAGSFQLGVEAGMANPDDGNYEETEVLRLVAGYEFIDDTLLVEVGVLELDDNFDLNDGPASIGLEGTDFQVSAIFGLGPANVIVGAGRFDWDATAYFNNRQVGEDSGSSPLFDIRLLRNLGSYSSFYIDGKHLRDVSGDNINLVMFGYRFSF